jgi:hypothetical protein
MKKWSRTHLQPVGMPCYQRSDNHPGCRNEKILDGFGVFSSWTWGVQNFNCSSVLLREERPESSLMSPSDHAAGQHPPTSSPPTCFFYCILHFQAFLRDFSSTKFNNTKTLKKEPMSKMFYKFHVAFFHIFFN